MNTVSSDIQSLIDFINHYVVPLIFAVAFVVFLWGVFQYFIAGGGNDESREKGRQFIMYGIIGFVLMFSIWGIVSVLYNSFGFSSNTRPSLPIFGGDTSSSGSTNTSGSTGDCRYDGCPNFTDLCIGVPGKCEAQASNGS